MDVRQANVIEKNENFFLKLSLEEYNVEIPLTEDKPNQVKSVFNELIKELKKEEFKFELKDTHNNIYYQICEEYLNQLNNELHNVYSDLKDYNLLETD